MKKGMTFGVVFFLLLMCGLASAETAYIDGKTANKVHMRSMPSVQADSMGLFYTGTEVRVEKAFFQDGWERVWIGEVSGFVQQDDLVKERPLFTWPTGQVKGGSLKLCAQPSKQSKVLATLKDQKQVLIMGETSNDWYCVLNTDGTIGYVMGQYVVLTGERSSFANEESRKVGETFDGYGIYSWIAPNGQTLYFSAQDDPFITMEDVNFDGQADVICTIIRGASNFFTEFFVWDNGQYVYARHPSETYGVSNYQLYPEYGLIHSDINNGYAGNLHEKILFRWEGTNLKAIRRAVSEEHCVMTDTADGFSLTYDTHTLHVRVWDYTQNIPEGELLYEALIDSDDLTTLEEHRNAFSGEQTAFWKGIR